jgi:integrase
MAKRRGHGEGSIYRRKDGRWCAEIYLGIVSGKPKRKTIYGRTRKEVSEKLKIALRDQQQGLNIAPERLTVAQFLDLWLDQVVRNSVRPRTHESYKHTVHKYLIPHLGHHQLIKLNPAHVQAMLNALHAAGLTRTVPYTRAVLVIALNIAVKWGYLARNVAALAEAPTVHRRDIQPLTKEQALALLDAVKGHRLEALYRIALSLGLRRGEVLGLWWEDVDLEAATIRITGALQRQQGKLERTATKTRASNRMLQLPAVLVSALQAHRGRQDRERRRADWKEHGLVFPSTKGTPMEPRNLNRHFARVLKCIGLPSTTRFHDLRHSAATLMLLQGVPLRVISKILGHTQMRVTADIYTHVLPELERDAAERMDALFEADADDAPRPQAEETEEQGGDTEEDHDDSQESNQAG